MFMSYILFIRCPALSPLCSPAISSFLRFILSGYSQTSTLKFCSPVFFMKTLVLKSLCNQPLFGWQPLSSNPFPTLLFSSSISRSLYIRCTRSSELVATGSCCFKGCWPPCMQDSNTERDRERERERKERLTDIRMSKRLGRGR